MKLMFITLKTVKYGFALSVIIGTVFVAKELTVIKHVKPAEEEALIAYRSPAVSENTTRDMLNENYMQCIKEPTKLFCILFNMNEIQILQPPEKEEENGTKSWFESPPKIHFEGLPSEVYSAIRDFSEATYSHGVEAVLIEPSILFCMLKLSHKSLLLKRGFNISRLLGAENVVTFGVYEKDAPVLDNLELQQELRSLNFSRSFVQIKTNLSSGGSHLPSKEFISHHFYRRQYVVVHVVLFFSRGHYLWYKRTSEIPREILQVVQRESLLFIKHDSAYERFSPVHVDPTQNTTLIPSNPQHFLFEIISSRFLECNHELAKRHNSLATTARPRYAFKKFKSAFVASLEEMKYELYPLLMNFVIYGGTLLGWYRQCNIIPYTTDVDFVAFSWDIDNAKVLIEKFKRNPNLKLQLSMGLPTEAFELRFSSNNVQVDLFFIYENNSEYWISGHRPSENFYVRYVYPKFDLCSAELLGRKIQVPCNPISIIEAEYGAEWQKPIAKWAYLKSPKNIGPKTYWNKTDSELWHKHF